MYQALYRKYRPKSFDQIVGQDHIVLTLRNQIKKGQISHAYLFTGTRGTGKTTTAKIFAKAINCLNPQNGSPCCECSVCKALSEENNVDIIEIDAASNNRVDEIRDIREKVKYLPVNAKYKVYIVDEVHMLTESAFNALLKTLEEPPSHIVFILATTEVHKLPATILSRCMRFDFHLINEEVLINQLKQIFKNENIPIELVDNEFSQNVYFTINNYELINFDTKLFQTNMPIIVLRLDDYNNFFNTYRKDININNYYIVINSDKPEIFDRYMNDIIDDNLEQNIEYMNYAYHDYEGRQVMSAIKFVGFTIIIAIALLSISAVFNTLNTNILTREKEFAMLRSIGLSKKDLNKLLIFEGIFLGLKTLIISLIVYIILLFGIKKFINFLSIASLKKLVFPIKYLVIAYIILLLVILLVIMYSKHKIKNKNIVDAIKNENI